MRKCVLCHMRTTKGAYQPAHPRSLISAFGVRCFVDYRVTDEALLAETT